MYSVFVFWCFLMEYVFFFYFIVLFILKVLDDDLIKVFMGVVWNSCFCLNWNGMEWFGILWIKVFLLKKFVFVGDIERLEILIGCCVFFLLLNIWRFDLFFFLCMIFIVLYFFFKLKYWFVDRFFFIWVIFWI